MFDQLRSVTILMVVGLVLVTISAAPQASSYDVELLRLTNFVRQKAGLPALRLSSRLGQVAQNHARDMAANNYFSKLRSRRVRPTHLIFSFPTFNSSVELAHSFSCSQTKRQ